MYLPNQHINPQVDHIYSKSKNSPMLGMEFKGEIIMTVCGDYAFGKVD